MEIKILKVGMLETNCYLLVKDNECLVIDPGGNYEMIKNGINGYTLKGVLLTHRHPDHIGALSNIVNEYNTMVYDKKYFDEQEYSIGLFTFNVVLTPGHTTDSISFYFSENKALFTGDFLFKESIGRTDLQTGNVDQMHDSVWKIKTFANDINVYPGHGPSTTLGHEKKNNPFLN